jgi:hypothetical protein
VIERERLEEEEVEREMKFTICKSASWHGLRLEGRKSKMEYETKIQIEEIENSVDYC